MRSVQGRNRMTTMPGSLNVAKFVEEKDQAAGLECKSLEGERSQVRIH